MVDYKGTIANIPVGQLGLITDLPQGKIPGGAVMRAQNLTYESGYVEKAPGSTNYNRTALPAGVAAVLDWWPNINTQRLITVCKNGKVYRHPDPENYGEVTATGTAPSTIDTSNYVRMLAAGQEESGNDRKIFIYNGKDPVQVIAGDNTTRANIATPAADWTTNRQPIMGIVYRGAHWAWGSDPHRMYKSDELDHEKFVGGDAQQYNVFPGDGEAILDAVVFRSRLFVVKKPFGLYYLNDQDTDSTNWYFVKLLSNFGVAGPKCIVPALDDVLVANQSNSMTTVAAAFQLGDVATADLFGKLKNKIFADNEVTLGTVSLTQGIWYAQKLQAIFTYRSVAGIQNDRLCVVDYRDAAAPRVSWHDKDQANCLALRRDDYGLERPIYGANDGYVYLMDRPDRSITIVGDDPQNPVTTGYRFEVETPHIDFRELNPLYAKQVKNFDWLEVEYIPTGVWDLTVEVFIDGRYMETINFSMEDSNSNLDAFRMDVDNLSFEQERSKPKQLHGSGRSIAFRCYNSVDGQNIKLVGLRVGFQISGQQDTR